jgi:site-specific DNA-methyltransferase (adenine-specific)
MFKSENSRKSIFILQKKGEGIVPPKRVMLVDLPKFSNKKALASIMDQIDEWLRTNK